MPHPAIDDIQIRTLLEQGLSQRVIATQLGVSRFAIAQAVKRLGLEKAPKASPKSPPSVDRRSDTVKPANALELPEALSGDLAELVAWWQDRKAALSQASDAERQTERTTFHVEKRWVEAIRRQADLDDTTMTHVCNEAFRQYFEGK